MLLLGVLQRAQDHLGEERQHVNRVADLLLFGGLAFGLGFQHPGFPGFVLAVRQRRVRGNLDDAVGDGLGQTFQVCLWFWLDLAWKSTTHASCSPSVFSGSPHFVLVSLESPMRWK